MRNGALGEQISGLCGVLAGADVSEPAVRRGSKTLDSSFD
jgi:hypothetical protein